MLRRMFLLALGGSAAAADVDQLADLMNAFARVYNQFAEQERRGIFDVKLARELSRRWRDVERSGDWPR